MDQQWSALVKRTPEETSSYSKSDIEFFIHEADSPVPHHTPLRRSFYPPFVDFQQDYKVRHFPEHGCPDY